jgi:hypothetical protein
MVSGVLYLIISNEEIRRSLRYRRESPSALGNVHTSIDQKRIRAIKAYLLGLPDTREAVVRRVRDTLPSYSVDARMVAEKMLGREIADSIR